MIASLLIIVVSTVLLIYWFRYTCLLMLRTQTARDYASGLAAANRLMYPERSRVACSRTHQPRNFRRSRSPWTPITSS